MLWRIGAALFLALVVPCMMVAGVAAETPSKNRGLFITPVREYIKVPAGQKTQGKFTLANITDRQADIFLSVDQFTVENFTYDYKFTPSKRDWIKLRTTNLKLQPGKSQEVSYTIEIPTGASPGGYYFTIFATETLDEAAERKVRVGEALYVTVGGDLRLTSEIEKETIPIVNFGGEIPFSLDVKSTGNSHFFMYVSGSLSGIATNIKGREAAQLLLPHTVRTIKGAIPPPPFPGIYEATYGYRVDDGQIIRRTKHIAYLPPWFLAVLGGTCLIAVTVWQRRRKIKAIGS